MLREPCGSGAKGQDPPHNVIAALSRKMRSTTLIAASAEVRGVSGRLVPVILNSKVPNAPFAVISCELPVACVT